MYSYLVYMSLPVWGQVFSPLYNTSALGEPTCAPQYLYCVLMPCTHYDFLIINSSPILFGSSLPVMVRHPRGYSAEFWRLAARSSAVRMPPSPNDRVGIVDNARKRGTETVQSSSSNSHCSKKHQSSTTLGEGPALVSPRSSSPKPSGSSSCPLHMHSNEGAINLPTGVDNVFPANNDQSRCCCPTQPRRATLASCDVAQVFVSQYGADNLAYLQDRERQEFPSKFPTSNRASDTSSQTSKEDEITGMPDGYISPPPGGSSDAKFWSPSGRGATAKFLEQLAENLPNQPWVTASMRATVVCWLVEVTVALDISEEAFHVAISILDKVFRSGATTEQYRANPDYDWDADFFCVRISEIQALGWYVFAFEAQAVSPCKDWISPSLPCDSLFPVYVYGWGASCKTSTNNARKIWQL